EVKQVLADTLVFANWPLYIDQKGKQRPSLDDFTKQTGVSVRYIEEVNDNEEWFGKYQAQLSQGQDIGRDLTVLTDWMAARMVRLGYVQKKDKSAIPNEANLVPTLQHPTWDPNRDYSIPWQSGFTASVTTRRRPSPSPRSNSCSPIRSSRARSPASRRCPTAWASSCNPTATTRPRSSRLPSTRRSARSRTRSTPDRSGASPATTTATTSRPATWPQRWSGPETSSSSSSTIRTSSSSFRTPEG